MFLEDKHGETKILSTVRFKEDQMIDPNMSFWQCQKCGYRGSGVIEDGDLDKKVKEAKKMEKLQKKLMRGR